VDIGGDREAWKVLTDSASRVEWGEWYQVGSASTTSEILGGVNGWEGTWKNVAAQSTSIAFYITNGNYYFPVGSPFTQYAGKTIPLSRALIPGFVETQVPVGWTLHNDKDWVPLADRTNPAKWKYWLTPTGTGPTGAPQVTCSRANSNSIEQSREVNVAVTTKQGEARTGTKFAVATSDLTSKLGDRIIDLSIVPYMRKKDIEFRAKGFKP
jgi:hypothetical protein